MEKIIVTCGVCGKEISERGFNRHLSIHYDPMSKNCNKWYKPYFKKDGGVCVCRLCDEEFYHEKYLGIGSAYQYEEHLLNEHNITREIKGDDLK